MSLKYVLQSILRKLIYLGANVANLLLQGNFNESRDFVFPGVLTAGRMFLNKQPNGVTVTRKGQADDIRRVMILLTKTVYGSKITGVHWRNMPEAATHGGKS